MTNIKRNLIGKINKKKEKNKITKKDVLKSLKIKETDMLLSPLELQEKVNNELWLNGQGG